MELFCSAFKKICVHTYRFRIVFARSHYNADKERSHMVASVHHFGYSRSSGLWRPVVSILMTSPFSISIVFTVHTRKQRFQIAPLRRAFPDGFAFGDRFRRCGVDDNRIRSKTAPFSFENGLVRTEPKIVVWERNTFALKVNYSYIL